MQSRAARLGLLAAVVVAAVVVFVVLRNNNSDTSRTPPRASRCSTSTRAVIRSAA